MGGSRCYFRECHVGSAKFPRMHFFRFPLKESDRYKKWREFSKMEKILKFTDMRRKNTSICGRHFRIECFMNYKMDRLTPSAVPTIMRLSDDKALDFELDIENGVLVTLDKTKSKHLIAPDGFECPLSLTSDKILLSILNELQSQQCYNTDLAHHTDCVELGNTVGYEGLTVTKPEKAFGNSVEILETIQVAVPRVKRSRPIDQEEMPISSVNNKKCKILNITYCEDGNGSINGPKHVLGGRSMQSCEDNSDEIDLMKTDQIRITHELVNGEEEFLTTDEVYIKDDYSEGTDDIEIIEVHKDDSSHYELPINDSDTTIVESKTDNQFYYTDRPNPEFLKMQTLATDLTKKTQDFDTLQVKMSLLEAENQTLKRMCKENDETNRKLLSLQIENTILKQTIKDLNALNDVEMQNCCEENRKLKEKTESVEILKCELLSRKEETKELKNLLESLKSKEEPNILKRNLERSQKQLHDTNTELDKVKTSLNKMKSENDRLSQHEKKLEQSLETIQNSFDIKQKDYEILQADFDKLKKENDILEENYRKLQASKNQEPTVSTSIKSESNQKTQSMSANSFSKAQLFNGIKRYLCASMVPLLRMEMFGSSEREWKSDERLVAVNILGLGEEVYKYFTDEWRIRLPALRDVRNWLSQSQIVDDEEDL